MTDLDLRPLGLGEILDRTFSLYRRHFLLFLGITGVPEMVVLALNVAYLLLTQTRSVGSAVGRSLLVTLALLLVKLITYLFSQGGTIIAVSEIYLGRPASISGSLRRVWDDLGFMFGVVVLNGLAVGIGFLLLVIPGLYLACRLLVCVPAALIEKQTPSDSLRRSFELTSGFVGRSFVIFVLGFVLTSAAQFLLSLPVMTAITLARDPMTLRFLRILVYVGSSAATVLVGPVLLIATSIFYYDLRVRKEAFDLQFMMDPDAANRWRARGVPSILS